jgi:hypothetical protein
MRPDQTKSNLLRGWGVWEWTVASGQWLVASFWCRHDTVQNGESWDNLCMRISCSWVSGNGDGSEARPHPALSLRRGCLLGPHWVWRERLLGRRFCGSGLMGRMGPIGRIGPYQTQSNQIKPSAGGQCIRRERAQNAQKVLWLWDFCLIAAMPLALRESRRIKANQTESNQIKPRRGRSGQWTVGSGWWRKRGAEYGPVKPGQTGQTESNRSNRVKPSQTRGLGD